MNNQPQPGGQIDMFNQPMGELLRDQGMKRAIDHANETHESWGDKAFAFLKIYMDHNKTFMVEQVREWANKADLPEPPSNRAWGAVIIRARREGLIYRVGFESVSNPKAHKTPASVWRVRLKL